jgi:hypothetical protein
LRRIGPNFGEGSDSTPGPPPLCLSEDAGPAFKAHPRGGNRLRRIEDGRRLERWARAGIYRHAVTTGPNQSFEFDFDKRFSPLLVMLGAIPSNSRVELRDDRVAVRLGPWRISSSTANVARLDVTGPYRWYRAIGLRLSLSDLGLTFGTNARRGLCIEFVRPVRSFLGVYHPAVTVTVHQPEMLKAAIEAAAPPGPHRQASSSR